MVLNYDWVFGFNFRCFFDIDFRVVTFFTFGKYVVGQWFT